jgi:hypothetical protein
MKITVTRPGVVIEFDADLEDPKGDVAFVDRYLELLELNRKSTRAPKITPEAPGAKAILEYVRNAEDAHSVNYIARESGIPRARSIIKALLASGDLELHDATYVSNGVERPMRGVYLKGFFAEPE